MDKLTNFNQKINLVFKLAGWIPVFIWAITDYMKGGMWELLNYLNNHVWELLNFGKVILAGWGQIFKN
jgi:hypothetical protein